jgi:hypothetical protein
MRRTRDSKTSKYIHRDSSRFSTIALNYESKNIIKINNNNLLAEK